MKVGEDLYSSTASCVCELIITIVYMYYTMIAGEQALNDRLHSIEEALSLLQHVQKLEEMSQNDQATPSSVLEAGLTN